MTSEFSEKETAQMRRAGEVKRIAASTLLRSAPLLAVVFAALWAAFAAALAARSERSPARYSAATKLIYAPRQNSKLPPLGDKQAFGVLDRASLKRSVADRADLSPAERGRLAGDIDFEQSPRPSNIFVVTARAPSASNAVAKANAFAAAVVDAYVEYRKHDIDAWASDLRRQKEEFEARLAEMDAAGAFPADPFSASVAAEAVSLFRGVASGHRRELGSLAAEIAGERAVVAELEKTLGTNGAAVVRNAPRLAAIGGEIAAIDADLTKLREKYTDRNPKVKGKLEDRAALAAEYGVLMAEAGLGSDGGGQFGLKADAARRLAGAVARLEALEARKAALEKEIADSDEKAVSAAGGAPGAERAAVRRNELERAVLGLEERLNDAMFFAATVSADLRQIEPAADVSERRPGGRRDIAAAGAAAAFCTAVLGLLFVAAADVRSRRRMGGAAAAAASVLALPLCGCATNGWNEAAYDDLEELGTRDAVIAESRRDAEAERKRRDFLEKLELEDDSVYRISPGDRIQIRVYGENEMDITTRIGPDGSIGMMFIGQTTVSGLTIAEARDRIEERLSEYVKHPVVGIAVLEVAGETVTVSGSASKPGLYQISEETRLADVYAMAGGSAARLFNGIVVDVADLENSTLIRNGRKIPVDFRAAIERGDPVENIRVRKGDYVFIAQRLESSVTICGDVRNPHKRLYEAGMGLLEALSSAGWMLDSHWRYVILIRDGLGDDPKMYKVDVDGILAGSRRNVRLRPNDVVFVPRDEAEGAEIASHRHLPEGKINVPAGNGVPEG